MKNILLGLMIALFALPAFGSTLCDVDRQTEALVSYDLFATTFPTDVTEAKVLFGRTNVLDSNYTPFPWLENSQASFGLNTGKLVAVQFETPSDVSGTISGTITYGALPAGPNLTISLTTACGELEPLAPQCAVSGVNGTTLKWEVDSGTVQIGADNICYLTQGMTYFMNVKQTPSSAKTRRNVMCSAGTCNVTLNSTFNHDAPPRPPVTKTAK